MQVNDFIVDDFSVIRNLQIRFFKKFIYFFIVQCFITFKKYSGENRLIFFSQQYSFVFTLRFINPAAHYNAKQNQDNDKKQNGYRDQYADMHRETIHVSADFISSVL